MENFEQYLMDKYPALFYKTEEGKCSCPCGIYCPEGWEKIIDDLCGGIVQYTMYTFRNRIIPTNKLMYGFGTVLYSVTNYVHRLLCKVYNKSWLNSKINKITFKIGRFRGNFSKVEKIYAPSIKIDQIKEKFGGLRFYYSGGDDEINGMVRLAEYICEHRCEVSGEPGELCKTSGGWYKTLSPGVREQIESLKNYNKVT